MGGISIFNNCCFTGFTSVFYPGISIRSLYKINPESGQSSISLNPTSAGAEMPPTQKPPRFHRKMKKDWVKMEGR